MNSHRRWTVGVVALLLLAVVVVVLVASRTDTDQLRWTLVGAGDDGRSVLVATPSKVSSCSLPKGVVKRASGSTIEIEVSVDRKGCAGETPLVSGPFVVSLGRRLYGQSISGPRYDPTIPPPAVPRRSQRLPNVVGLRVTDATRILRRAGLTVMPVPGGTPTSTVVEQEPLAGIYLHGRWAPPDIASRLEAGVAVQVDRGGG